MSGPNQTIQGQTIERAPRPADAPAIAVVGGGAAAQSYHLPALARRPEVMRRVVLVERDAARGEALAARYGVRTAQDLAEVLPEVDAAIIATPHRWHHAMTLECVRAGVHVLCEKPLAETAEQADEVADESERRDVVVAVNHARRLIPSYRRIQRLLAEGAIGRPRHIDISWGEVFDWPSATAAYFGAGGSTRGVLLDLGAHAMDLVAWWLGGRPAVTAYRDDSRGGTEAVAAVAFERDGCTGEVWLSWLSNRRNRIRVEGDRGAIECGLYDWDTLTLVDSSGRRTQLRTEPAPERYEELTAGILENFLLAVQGQARPVVTARDALPSLQIIDECYARRERFEMPWEETFMPGGVAR